MSPGAFVKGRNAHLTSARATANHRFGLAPNSLAQNDVFTISPPTLVGVLGQICRSSEARGAPPLARVPRPGTKIEQIHRFSTCRRLPRGQLKGSGLWGAHLHDYLESTSSGRSASPSGTVSVVRWRFALWTSGSRTAIRPRRSLSCETASRMGSATPGSAALAACYGVCLGRGGYRITVPRSGVPGPGWVRPLNTPPLRRAIS